MRAWSLLTLLMLAFGIFCFAGGFERPPMDVIQRGYRGLGMVQIVNPRRLEDKLAQNKIPDPQPTVDPAGTPSSEAYENVKVLGDVDSAEFIRLMAAITDWVAPQQGCNYCHSEDGNFASDALYTKVVARRMLQMVRNINGNWQTHVNGTGVTCYTCHRGQPVPANVWFHEPGRVRAAGLLGNDAGQNDPIRGPDNSSLPYDSFTPFLEQDNNIRVVATTALPGTDHKSIKQTEWTYALMTHFSTSLGVNCTYCHNSRSFFAWDQSTPQRSTAWYGIRMVRDVNNDYLNSLHGVFPPYRLGVLGDVAKVNCNTCHQGAFKPLYGISMLKDYPELGAAKPAASASAQ